MAGEGDRVERGEEEGAIGDEEDAGGMAEMR